jgi:hypothetical protein
MAKRIALMDSVSVDATDLSNLCRSVRFSSEHSREDVSGFSATGMNEYLPGPTEQSVTCEFYGSYGAGEVHETLYPIHKDREVVAFAWRPDQNSVASATNPELRGNVQLYSYGPGGARGDVDTFEVTFNAADEDGLQFFNAPDA